MASAPGNSTSLKQVSFLDELRKHTPEVPAFTPSTSSPASHSSISSPSLINRVLSYIPNYTKESLLALSILGAAYGIERNLLPTWSLIVPAIPLAVGAAKKVVDCCKSNQTKAKTDASKTSAGTPTAVGAAQLARRAKIQSMLDKQNAQAISALTQMLINSTKKQVGAAVWKMMGGQIYSNALRAKNGKKESENTSITIKDIIEYKLLDRRIELLKSLEFKEQSHFQTKKNLEEAIELIKSTATEKSSSIGAILHLFAFAYVIHFNPETKIFTLQDPKGDAPETFETETKMIDRIIEIQKKFSYKETCKGQPLLLKLFAKKDDKPAGAAERKKEI